MQNQYSTTRAILWLVVFLTALNEFALALPGNISRQTSDVNEDEDETRAVKVYDRYVKLLKQNPRPGTPLDRIYEFHVDRGTLDSYIKSLNDETSVDDADGSSSMILGLMELRRGRDIASVSAFRQAEQRRPTDAIASWYLGRALTAIGETDNAVMALERSISKSPSKADQLEIYQSLGQLLQRHQRTEQALNVWKQFEAAFPNDKRVQLQIAAALAEEGQFKEAIQRFQSLSQNASDPYQKVQFAVQAADLKLKLGQQQDALHDLEDQLQRLKPSSWLYNDVRRRIDGFFLQTDDYAGLVDYYQSWVNLHPDDLDAMARIGQYLSIQGRRDIAIEWYQKAITRAPSDASLRLALIELLTADGKYASAITQYEHLDKFAPGNPDNVERWGMLYLRHEGLTELERKAKASEIWTSLLTHKPNDASVSHRVAELFRAAAMVDEALTLYKKCVQLAPGDVQYLEYLGEYYHTLQRHDKARATWQQIVAGNLRNTQSLVRLSEIFNGFGYKQEALTTMQDACNLDPGSGDLIRLSTMLRDNQLFDESLKQLDRASSLTASPEEQQIILDGRIATYMASGQLAARTDELISAIGNRGTSDQWRVLALYQEALNRMAQAARSAQQAVDLSDGSIAAWKVAARVMEKAGMLSESSSANKQLAALDRRYRTQYIKKIAELEHRLGRIDNALQAGQDLLNAGPGNPGNYQFFADLCFRLGRPDAGLDALRKSVRLNPSDADSLTSLAKALAEQFKTPEAIELYWRAFSRNDDLDGKVRIIQTLTELYLQTNAFDRLIGRLETMSAELSQPRDMAIILANSYQSAGDIGMARKVLETQLETESHDVLLLAELSRLSEQAEAFDDAVAYQQQLTELSASPDAAARLANLLIKSGHSEAAEAVLANLQNSTPAPHQIIISIDGLIESNKFDSARTLCDQLLFRNSDDWEARLRLAVINWKQDQKTEAVQQCDRLLAMQLDDNTPSHERQFSRSPNRTVSSGSPNSSTQSPVGSPRLIHSKQMVPLIISNLGIKTNRRLTSLKAGASPWSATDFAEARSTAISIKMGYAIEQKKADELLADLKDQAERHIATAAQPAWDYFIADFFQRYSGGKTPQNALTVAELLNQRPEPEAKLLYLISLQGRSDVLTLQGTPTSNSAAPLPDAQLKEMMDAWNIVNTAHPEWSTYFGGVQMVIQELKKANKTDKADELFQSLIRPEASVGELLSATQIVTSRGDLDQLLSLTHRIVQHEHTQGFSSDSQSTVSQLGFNFSKLASTFVAEQEDWMSVKKLITAFLDFKADSYTPVTTAATHRTHTPGFSIKAHYQVFAANEQLKSQQIETLSPNDYLTSADITFVVNLHALYKNRINQLLDTLQTYRATAANERAVFAELLIAHIQFLIGSNEQAAIHLVRAAELAPDDISLRANLVQFYQTAGNNKDALALLETVEAVDQGVVKEREQLVLNLAIKTGSIDRAKIAAERLFGLRLDDKEALDLSTQLQMLGMKKLSQALLARTRNSAGNDVSTLMALMTQYKEQGNVNVASQIAHQIMRKTSPHAAGAGNFRNAATMTSARLAAVDVLGQSGQLDSMIERVRDQLTRSPTSIPLYQTLEEYYHAAGKTKEAEEVATQLAELQPSNPDTLLRMAQQLERSRRYSEACDKYLLVLEQDIQRYGQNYYLYLRTFQNAKRLGELADVLMKADLTKLQNNYQVVTETVQYLVRESGRGNNAGSSERRKGLELFAAAWKAFTKQRTYMLSSIQDESLWASPEILNYAREGMIPGSVQQAVAQPWLGIASSMSYNSDATVTSTLTRVCNGLTAAQDMQEFIQIVRASIKQHSGWHGGNAILCVLEAKHGNIPGALQILNQLKANAEGTYLPTNVAWVLGCILEPIDPAFRPYAIELLETTLARDSNQLEDRGFAHSPWRRLAILYGKAGDNSRARELIYKGLEASDVTNISVNNPGYQQHTDLLNYQNAATQLLDLGFSFDAIGLYRKITPELVAACGRFVGKSTHAVAEARAAEREAMKNISPAAVASYFKSRRLLNINRDASDNSSDSTLTRPLDLMLIASGDGGSGRINSIVLNGLLAADLEKNGDRDNITNILFERLQPSETLDPSAAIAAVVLGDKLANSELKSAGFLTLAKYLKTKQHEIPPQTDIGLWLAFRVAFKSEDSRSHGLQLATRAQAAAEASGDCRWLISMMKERGDMAISEGDKPAAEKAWTQLLDAVLADASGRQTGTTQDSTTSSNAGSSGTALQELRDRLLKQPAANIP